MSHPENLDSEISDLENRLATLKQEREQLARREKVLAELKSHIDSTLASNGLAVRDLLQEYAAEVARMGARKGRGAAPSRRRKRATSKTTVVIKDVGQFEVASRGKLPEALKGFMDANGLDRATLIKRYGR